MARTVLVIESEYFPYLTSREVAYIAERHNKSSFMYYHEPVKMIGLLEDFLQGRTGEEFITELKNRASSFNTKYLCDKTLSVKVDEDRLFIKFAYNEQLKNELKKELNAKWHAESKEWVILLADEKVANNIVKKYLGRGFLK